MIGLIEYDMSTAKVAGKKILLIEDHDMSREKNRLNLHNAGFFVVEAKDGSEGIKLLSEYAPDVIILDLYMEDMDGFTVLKILRATPKWKAIPVLIFSSSINQTTIDRLIAIGADDFLLKTQTSPEKLIETVKSLLQRKGKS